VSWAGNPTNYQSLHNPYTRAPSNSVQYTFGNSTETETGYIPYFRVFIPPGTLVVDLLIQENGKQIAVARYKIPPTKEPTDASPGTSPKAFTLTELEAADCWSSESMQGNLYVAFDAFLTALSPARSGWLYAKVGGGVPAQVYYNLFTVKVDTKTYNEWWDTYIKDAAGWDRYVESVQAYVDPSGMSTPTPTPIPTITPIPTPVAGGPKMLYLGDFGTWTWNGSTWVK
jgi:hypothetical protein